MAGVELREAVEQSCAEQGPGAEDDEEDVAQERFARVGVDADAVGEDDQREGGGAGDDEAFAPGGELGGRGDASGLGDEVFEGVTGLGEREGAGQGDGGADGGDVGAGVECDEALEVDGDRDGAEPADGERGSGGEEHGLGGACRVEPAEAADVEEGQGEEEGEGAGDEVEDLESGRGAVVGEVPGEVGRVGPGHEGAGDGGDGADGDEDAGRGLGERDETAGRGGGVCGCHGAHALSATRSPMRPCGLNSSTRMRSTKAQTEDQPPPPSCCMPGMPSM